MIVPSMSINEVYREVMTDFETVHRKAGVQGQIFQNEMLRKKRSHETRTINYKTAHFNEWHIMFRIFQHYIHQAFYVRSTDKRGPVTYGIQFNNDTGQKLLVKHNTHFFKRYNQRLQLNLEKPAEVIKHFFKHNFDREQAQSEVLANGRRLVQFVFSQGVGVGWQDDEKKLINIKTFIANDTLNKSQKSLVEFIKDHDDSEQFTAVMSADHLK